MDIETGIVEVRLEDIIPNRFQPRLSFDEKALNELAESIKQHGIIQPLVLRKIGEKYEIIAGERRYKAAGIAGLDKVPAVITNIDDNSSAEVALVENIQRKNLTAIEEAKSFRNLLDKGYLTQDELSKKMGLSQSAISNKLRLLNLDEEVQEALLGEKISERHARALLQLEDKESQKNWLHKIIRDRLTVRQLDMELKKILKGVTDNSSDVPLVDLTPDVEQIKNNTADLNPIKEAVTYNEFANVTEVKEAVEEKTEAEPDKMPRKFFNFLEDEVANMNTEETTPTAFEITPPEESTSDEESIEILDMPMPSANVEPQPMIDQIMNQNEQNIIQNVQPSNLLSPFDLVNSSLEKEPETTSAVFYDLSKDEKPLVDPVTMIEKLDPDYEKKAIEAAGLDLKSAIAMVRESVKEIEEKGFIIDSDEIDLEGTYQIIININKNNI